MATTANIAITRSAMVVPAEPTPNETLWISNLDMTMPNIHAASVYFYDRHVRDDGCDDFFSWDVMAEALARALVPFYPVAGRLRYADDRHSDDDDDDDGGRPAPRLCIDCNGRGVLLVEARADVAMREFAGDFSAIPALRRLIPPVDYTKGVGAYPLLVLQITFFTCGNVTVGVGLEHHVVDGVSGVHFINTWADFAQGCSYMKVPPFIDRTILKARNPPTPSFVHTEYHHLPSLLDSHLKMSKYDHGISHRIFHLTKDQIMILKRKANSETKTCEEFSTYEVVASHVWKCISKVRQLSHLQETQLFIATDGRSRLSPPLPMGYFGNVVFATTPHAMVGDLIDKPLVHGAKKIKHALKRMDNEYLRSALDYLETQPDLYALVRGAHTFRPPNLGITSWVRFPSYEANFGWGKPIFMGPAGINFEGLAYLLPRRERDGINISLALIEQHMEEFKNLLYNF